MALFRKKLTKEKAVSIAMELFESRFKLFWKQIVLGIIKIDKYLDNNEVEDGNLFEKALDIWIICAALLSQLRQRGEASDLTALVVEAYRSSDSEYDRLSYRLASAIISSYKNDDKLFHNVSYEIFKKTYINCQISTSCYGDERPDTFVISGIELAACLRAVDFILKEYKLSR